MPCSYISRMAGLLPSISSTKHAECPWSGGDSCLGYRAGMVRCPSCLYGRIVTMVSFGYSDVRMGVMWGRLQRSLGTVSVGSGI